MSESLAAQPRKEKGDYSNCALTGEWVHRLCVHRTVHHNAVRSSDLQPNPTARATVQNTLLSGRGESTGERAPRDAFSSRLKVSGAETSSSRTQGPPPG